MTLREQLGAAGTTFGTRLRESYQRIAEIAAEEWIPALPPHDESHAGLPHTRNVEREVEKLLAPVLSRAGSNAGLSDLEAYILLASIQLHDIGRQRGRGKHGRRSADLILRSKAQLGLLADEHIVDSVAEVCECHDLDADQYGPKLKEVQGRQASLEGYGPVRLAALAAVLAIGDEMDESYLRALPPYLEPEAPPPLNVPFLQRGEMRRRIRSVEADAIGGCIVCDFDAESEVRDALRDGRIRAAGERERIGGLVRPLLDDDKCRSAASQLILQWRRPDKPTDIQQFIARLPSPPAGPDATLAKVWRALDLLREKDEKVVALRRFLLPLGVDYQRWFLDVGGVLYDSEGRQQYEPGLDLIEIQSVGEAIGSLASRVFGRWEFSYAELAAEARASSPAAVRKIVRRIALWETAAAQKCSIVLGPDTWSLLSGDPGAVAREIGG